MTETGHTLLGLIVALGGVAPGFAAEAQATPTPTHAIIRRELHLGEYADRLILDRSGLEDRDSTIVISNRTVDRLSDFGTLSMSGESPVSPGPPLHGVRASPTPVGPARRSHWQRRVRQQRQIIDAVENELALVDVKIDALEDAAFEGGLRAKSRWVKLAEAKGRRRVVDRRLQNERAKLAAIIREARREGAEPGWFR
jgi:hypothetical protein